MIILDNLTTERLLLRHVTIEDASLVQELMNTPKWLQYIGDRNVHTVGDAQTYIRNKMLPQLHKLGYGNYVVIRKEDGAKLGFCGIYERNGLDICDLGFAFLPAYEGKGYASEAAMRLLKGAREVLQLPALSAITSIANLGSQKLLKKLGFQYEKMIILPNDTEEIMYFFQKL